MQELSGSKKQYANIITIDHLIRRGTYPSVGRLAEVTGVSQRQVLRILKDMKEVYKAPLHYDRQRKGYCYLLDGYSVADISLDEDESLALQLCNDFIAKVFGGTQLFRRLHRACPPSCGGRSSMTKGRAGPWQTAFSWLREPIPCNFSLGAIRRTLRTSCSALSRRGVC